MKPGLSGSFRALTDRESTEVDPAQFEPAQFEPAQFEPAQLEPGPLESADPADPAEPAGRVPFAALVLALVAGGMAILLVLNTATAASEVKQREIDKANAVLYDKEQQLSRDVADLQSPEELAKRAAELGLIPADSPAFIRVNADGSVTVLGSPAPATTQPPAVTPSPTAAPAGTPTDPTPAGTAPAGSTPTPASPPTPTPTPTPTPSPAQAPTTTVTLPGGPR